MTHLTPLELESLQKLNNSFTNTKISLGDLELQKHNLLKTVDSLKSEFAEHEAVLIEKYGKDSVINLQTGEVTTKTD